LLCMPTFFIFQYLHSNIYNTIATSINGTEYVAETTAGYMLQIGDFESRTIGCTVQKSISLTLLGSCDSLSLNLVAILPTQAIYQGEDQQSTSYTYSDETEQHHKPHVVHPS
uniref:LSM14 domain-containing protein n=1 Tax=Haemonchus placei TaxID=6290 RepID=A0A158QQU0_HAEPC